MQSKLMTENLSPDYAQFSIKDGRVIPGPRMLKKLEAIPFPDLGDKSVLDVGCDYGQFSFWAASQGASSVVGLDRNRDVRGLGRVDLVSANNNLAREHFPVCSFKEVDLGKQWHEFGKFDVIFMFSMYHHVFENCGDHNPIWFWLWRHCNHSGEVLWENPVDLQDVVSDKHISGDKRAEYSRKAILEAAEKYFTVEHIGHAKHEPHREVYRFKPLPWGSVFPPQMTVIFKGGAGGATKAFLYKEGRRIKEVARALGWSPVPGSLNMDCFGEFDWNKGYYPAEILDVKERGKGLDVEWYPRRGRLYPVNFRVHDTQIKDHAAAIFRFEGERYRHDFLEALAPVRLRDFLIDQASLSQGA